MNYNPALIFAAVAFAVQYLFLKYVKNGFFRYMPVILTAVADIVCFVMTKTGSFLYLFAFLSIPVTIILVSAAVAVIIFKIIHRKNNE